MTNVPPRLVFFDGVCRFCDGAVRWLLDRDPEARLRFAPLQGETAAALRTRHPEFPTDVETLVYVETDASGEHIYLRSDAIFRVVEQVRSPWRHVARLRWLPRWLTDAVYRVFVRNRYRIFGKLDECAIPTADERTRFVA
jgi:predicted DCC family thiol-disulfide oxidoreductase YuxK